MFWGSLAAKSRVLLPYGIITLTALIVFVSASIMDPEPYHDGSQFAPALAIANGMRIHSDVFSAYGFITALLQGSVLMFMGDELIWIRIFNAFLLSIVALQMYAMGLRTLGSRLIALGLSLTWIVLWPGAAVFWSTPLLPWPSVVFLVFQLSAVHLILIAIDRGGDHYRVHNLILFVVSGILTGIALLTRINYGVALFLSLLLFVLLQTREKRIIAAYTLGFITGVCIPLVMIVFQGVFTAFMNQSIIGPLQGKAIVSATPLEYVFTTYLWSSLPTATLIIIALAIGRRNRWKKSHRIVLVSFLVSAAIVWSTTGLEDSLVRNLILSRLSWTIGLDIQAMQPFYFVASATVICAFLLLGWLINRNTPSSLAQTKKYSHLMLFGLSGLASLIQLFPIADPNHLWWAIPLPLIFILVVIKSTSSTTSFYAATSVLLVPALFVSVATNYTYFGKERVRIDEGILSGMYISVEYMDSVREVDKILRNIPPHSTVFHCHEGLFPVWHGAYLSSGAGYVDYAYGISAEVNASNSQFEIFCIESTEDSYNQNLRYWKGRPVLDQTPGLKLSYFSNSKLVVVPVVPNHSNAGETHK